MKKRILSLALALALSLSLAVPALAVYETPTFTDVPKSFWGYASIEQAAENKWISGNPDGTFAPNANVTYAQFCVMLVSAFFPEQLAGYTGPTSPWYVPACMVAAQNDLLLGTRVEQTPTLEGAVSQPMSRYEMALVVSNTLYKINAKLPTPKERADQMDTTPDFWDIEYKYQSPVLLAKATGVLSGMDSAGTFGGSGNLSRAQAAVVLGKLNDLRNTGDGSAVNPNLPEPATPTEITRSPFAFQDGENVQQMMNRLNAEAPKYYEGYLTNGKPITEENIQAMLAEAEKGMPTGTPWDASSQYRYGRSNFYPGTSGSTGCNSFAAALSDYVFGLKAPITVHQNFDELKAGDVIWLQSSKTGYSHVVFVTDLRPTTADSYMYVDGNNDTYGVWWGGYGYMDDWGDTQKAETYIYSRY
ncbi:S-layer homology domain-containing protein [Oscillospiraceae bacterium 50-16]